MLRPAMEALDALAAGIKHVDSLLDEAALEPDVARDDWDRMATRVAMVKDAIDDDLLGPLDEALESAQGAEVRAVIQRRVASLLAEAAAMFHAAGDATAARACLDRARDLAPPAQRAEVDAALAEPALHARLVHGRWLYLHGRQDEGLRAAKAVAAETKEEALRRGARELLRAPQPIKGAPPLFRINGFGVGLYGERDRTADGWYVATYCVSALWIPILPLAAYRVRKSEQGYEFVAREALSPLARAAQIGVLVAALLGIGWGGVSSYLGSPDRKAQVALEEGRRAEARGDRQAAMERFTEVSRSGGAHVAAAAEALVRLGAASVPEPCTAAALDKVARVVDGYHAMPTEARKAASAPLTAKLEAWAKQIGEATAVDQAAALDVLDMAARVAEGGPREEAVNGRRASVRRVLAASVAAERPLRALALYAASPGDAESVEAAAKLVEGFGEGPSLYLEAEPEIMAWAAAADKRAQLAASAAQARERIAAAKAAHAAAQPILEAGDEKQMAAALSRSPRDHELAVGLAQAQRRRGDAKAALATLTALGAPGQLTAHAQQLLAACRADGGDLAQAESILAALFAERLPAFQAAQREFSGAMERAQEQLVQGAKSGHYDSELGPRMQSAHSDADKARVFREWIGEQLGKDAHLAKLRAEYLRHEALVPTALSLGQIKLRRAQGASGEERRALLAAAEATFLSIQHAAEGDPSYHIGLGQVLHRLGRAVEGDKELGQVVARKVPELSLAVADTYRDLGLPVQAKKIAEEVWKTAGQEQEKQRAAMLLAHLVKDISDDEKEEETWIERGDPKSLAVEDLKLHLEVRRLTRQGKFAEADKVFTKIAALYEPHAARDAVAANNLALVYQHRFQVSGDREHLQTALKHLENARRLEPQNAMVISNLASVLAHAGVVAVLDRWVKTRVLAPSNEDTYTVLSALLEGPLRGEVLAALRKDRGFQRSLDLAAEEQALAPQRPVGYQWQLYWLTITEDTAALEAMEKRLAAMPPFDASATAESRRRRRDDAQMQVRKTHARQLVERAEQTVQRVEQGGHAPTLAAARFLLAEHRARLLELDRAPEHVEPMLEVARKAAQGWPEGGAAEGLPSLLISAATARAAAEVPAVKTALDAEGRIWSGGMLLHRLTTGPQGAEVLAALRQRPEIAEAARLRKARGSNRPSLYDLMLARVAGDAELEQAAAAAFDRRDLGAELAIEALMAPGQDVEKLTLAFWKGRGK
jgi:hypothetical protein